MNLDTSGEFNQGSSPRAVYTRLNLLQPVCDTHISVVEDLALHSDLAYPFRSGAANHHVGPVPYLARRHFQITHFQQSRRCSRLNTYTRQMFDLIHHTTPTPMSKRETVTAVWIDAWRGHIKRANPPNRCSLVPALEYLRVFFQGRVLSRPRLR
jgi:hypothetical protein